jgi:glutathione S-transferase
MRLYDYKRAPNPRRVRIFIAEKGLDIPTQQVDLGVGGQFAEDFRRRNPFMTVPVLELDDGRCIAESVAICRYLELLHPDPALFGGTALEQAEVEMWSRRAELYGLAPAADVVRNALPFFADHALPGTDGGVPQLPALVERGEAALQRFFRAFDRRLGESEFVAGKRYTVADITAQVTIDFAGWRKLTIPQSCPSLKRWHQEVTARPSASA